MGIARVARGFRVSGEALDGVVEAIEADGDKWFAMGVQWRPASASASHQPSIQVCVLLHHVLPAVAGLGAPAGSDSVRGH